MAEVLSNDNLSDVISSNAKVVALYSLSWCDKCAEFKNAFTAASSEFSDVKFVIVDGEQHPNSLSLATIEVFPTTVFFENGANKDATITKNADTLKEFIAENK